MASLLSGMEKDLYLEPSGSPVKIPFGILKIECTLEGGAVPPGTL